MQPHVHARPRTNVSVIDVKCYNIIQPQHVKCKQNGGWAKYCAFVLENREESQKNAESCPKLSRRQLYRYFQCRCLVSSVLLLTHKLFQWAPSLLRVWSESRSSSPISGRSWCLPYACHCTSPKSGRLCELKRIPGSNIAGIGWQQLSFCWQFCWMASKSSQCTLI